MIVIVLIGIEFTLDRISVQLADIQHRLALAQCITEAKYGMRCAEAS